MSNTPLYIVLHNVITGPWRSMASLQTPFQTPVCAVLAPVFSDSTAHVFVSPVCYDVQLPITPKYLYQALLNLTTILDQF